MRLDREGCVAVIPIIGLLIAFYTGARCISALGWNVQKGESVIGKVAWVICLIATTVLALALASTPSTH